MPELQLRSPVYLNQKVDHHKTYLNLADSELECKERKKEKFNHGEWEWR